MLQPSWRGRAGQRSNVAWVLTGQDCGQEAPLYSSVSGRAKVISLALAAPEPGVHEKITVRAGQACSGLSRDVGKLCRLCSPAPSEASFFSPALSAWPVILGCSFFLTDGVLQRKGFSFSTSQPFLATQPDEQLYKWWALLHLLPQLQPQTHEPSLASQKGSPIKQIWHPPPEAASSARHAEDGFILLSLHSFGGSFPHVFRSLIHSNHHPSTLTHLRSVQEYGRINHLPGDHGFNSKGWPQILTYLHLLWLLTVHRSQRGWLL